MKFARFQEVPASTRLMEYFYKQQATSTEGHVPYIHGLMPATRPCRVACSSEYSYTYFSKHALTPLPTGNRGTCPPPHSSLINHLSTRLEKSTSPAGPFLACGLCSGSNSWSGRRSPRAWSIREGFTESTLHYYELLVDGKHLALCFEDQTGCLSKPFHSPSQGGHSRSQGRCWFQIFANHSLFSCLCIPK